MSTVDRIRVADPPPRSPSVPRSFGADPPAAPRSDRSLRPDRVERAARLVHRLRRVLPLEREALRLWTALTVALTGVLLLCSAALADRHLHRGVMTGAEQPYVFHPVGQDMAVNLDLAVVRDLPFESVATVLQANGFRFVRVTFLWSEIEPEAGQPAWERADAVVDELDKRDIGIVAVLRGTPSWARSPDMQSAPDAPPRDPAAFGGFVSAFLQRFGDRVSFVQIWDLPNRPDRWGGATATPADYANLLAAADAAVQASEREVNVVLAEFEPRPGAAGAGDLEFLRGVYAAGGAPFFDVVAATADGGGLSPFDRRVDPDRTNLSRLVLVREVMEDAGDAATPVWGTRYGWNAADVTDGVTAEVQADFALDGIQRAREEWPWLGLLFAWTFITTPDDPSAGYALLTPEGSATPLFTGLAAFATDSTSAAAGVGHVPPAARSVTYTGRWQEQGLPPQAFLTTTEVGATVRVVFDGTGLIAYLRRGPNAGTVDALIDGRPMEGWSGSSLASFQARNVPLVVVSGLEDRRHELAMTLTAAGDLTLGGFVVTRDRPFLWPVALLATGGAVLLAIAIWQATRIVAMRAGVLRLGRGDDVWVNVPELPHVPTARRI